MWFQPADRWQFNLVLNSKSSPNILLWNIDIITWIDFWWYQTNWKSCTRNVDRKPIWRFRDTSWRSDFLSRITSLSDHVSKTAKSITRSLAGYYFSAIMRSIYSFLYQDRFQLEIHAPDGLWTGWVSDTKPIKLFDIHGNRIDWATEEKIRKSICQSTKECRRKKDAMKILKCCLSNRDSWTTTGSPVSAALFIIPIKDFSWIWIHDGELFPSK